MKHKQAIIEIYQNRIKTADEEIDQNKRMSSRYSYLRLGVFMVSIPFIYFLIGTNITILMIAFVSVFAIFVWAVLKQQKYDLLLKEAESFKAINENEINALISHDNTYYNGVGYEKNGHYYADDLDVFGAHSIFALLNRSRTFYGNTYLEESLLKLPAQDEVLDRQEAVAEMSEDIEWRQKIAVKLFDIDGMEHYDIAANIEEYLSADLSFASQPIVAFYRKALPIIWVLIAVTYYFNSSIGNTLASVVFIGNLLLVGKYTKQVSEVQGRLSQMNTALKSYMKVLTVIFEKKWKSVLLRRTYESFDSGSGDLPIGSLSDLSKIINQLDYRLNLLVAIVGNGLVLWDLRVIDKLSHWKAENPDEITKIFEWVGQLEWIMSLSTWAYNHPQYCYPEVTDSYLEINATHVEHPLIPDGQNVANDFAVSPTDKAIIVTGSNMSGKSTLLRTIGLNMILGYTGTKVAAHALTIPIVEIITYMRIKDALEENVSTFKAELNRISMILDRLSMNGNNLVLIDEMLRGTNSRDKLYGSIGITKKLLDSNAYAMIATHDIKLAELGSDDTRIANYYFDIDYEDGELVFDYKVKNGICRNFNASFLLGKLGIDTEIGQ